jgi:hypothetical protein
VTYVQVDAISLPDYVAQRVTGYRVLAEPSATTTAAPNVGVARVLPLIVRVPFTIDRIGVEVTALGDATSQAQQVTRFAVFAAATDATLQPVGSPVVDLGSSGVVAATGLTPITVNYRFTPGLWWIATAVQRLDGTATAFTTAATLRCANGPYPQVLGTGSLNVGSMQAGYQIGSSVTAAYGDITAGLAANLGGNNASPRVHARIASYG